MGMIVSVYRDSDGYDCTAGGISSKVKNLTVVNVDGPFEPTPDRPAAVLLPGHYPGTVRLLPKDLHKEGRWLAFGGNYAATSDSRWCRAIEKLIGGNFYGAVAIHDRFEMGGLGD